MLDRAGYCITTWRLRLYRKHPGRFLATKELYSSVVEFYLRLIVSRNLQNKTSYTLQREVEVLTQGERQSGTPPACPLPYGKVPLYFRRAALNEAAGLASHLAGREAPNIDTSPVYYKGMYRNLDMEKRRIELKLYTGEKWEWGKYRFAMDGRVWKAGMEFLSPTIKAENGEVFLCIPVKTPVADSRTVKERSGERYLCTAFGMGETLAGCVAVTPQKAVKKQMQEEESSGKGRPAESGGRETGLSEREGGRKRKICMIHGGDTFRRKRRQLEEALVQAKEDAKQSGAAGQSESKRMGKLRKELSRLIRNEAHRVSREILEFAKEQGCQVIVTPDYQGNLGLNWKKWIAYSEYDWIARRCIQYLSYKAFQNGIVLCRIPAKDLSRYCCRCGEELRPAKEWENGKVCLCRNGHRQNRLLNTAENAGKRYEELNSGMKDAL